MKLVDRVAEFGTRVLIRHPQLCSVRCASATVQHRRLVHGTLTQVTWVS